MTACADYAALYETQFRPRARVRRLVARLLWAALLLVRPRLAMEIWRERA